MSFAMSAQMMAFVERVQAGEAPAVAAAAVGYDPESDLPRLLGDQRVRVALAQAQYPAAPVTREDLVAQLHADHALATSNGEAGPAVAATMATAKLLGMVIDKQQVDVSVIDRLSPEAVRTLLAEVRAELAVRRARGEVPPLLEARVIG